MTDRHCCWAKEKQGTKTKFVSTTSDKSKGLRSMYLSVALCGPLPCLVQYSLHCKLMFR